MKFFAWNERATRNDNRAPHPQFMNRYIQYRHLNLSNPNDVDTTTNIVISDGTSEENPIQCRASCYVPDLHSIINISSGNEAVVSKCNKYCISRPCAIFQSGASGLIRSDPNMLSIKRKKDFCSAIVVDKTCLNDRHTQNTYGFEMQLPTFKRHICDDIIYSPRTKSVIAYQAFHSKCNKLFYLNQTVSDWRLLTQINWTKSASPASMIPMDRNKQLFISTNSGETVCLDLARNQWQRLPVLNGIVKPYTFDEVPIVPQRPVFTYNESHSQMVRMNMNKDTNYYFDVGKEMWIKMNFRNVVKRGTIQQQILFVNDVSPNILYTTIHAKKNEILYAKCDQRDHTQNKWNVMRLANMTHNAFRERDLILSMF